uniref:LITAF domain-containing protein n=1 Tax=Glossina brevipalpis TaxID=37001 RepID=A0A1A9X4Z5_9MUSC
MSDIDFFGYRLGALKPIQGRLSHVPPHHLQSIMVENLPNTYEIRKKQLQKNSKIVRFVILKFVKIKTGAYFYLVEMQEQYVLREINDFDIEHSRPTLPYRSSSYPDLHRNPPRLCPRPAIAQKWSPYQYRERRQCTASSPHSNYMPECGPVPIPITCPTCRAYSHTRIKRSPTIKTHLMSLLLCTLW